MSPSIMTPDTWKSQLYSADEDSAGDASLAGFVLAIGTRVCKRYPWRQKRRERLSSFHACRRGICEIGGAGPSSAADTSTHPNPSASKSKPPPRFARAGTGHPAVACAARLKALPHVRLVHIRADVKLRGDTLRLSSTVSLMAGKSRTSTRHRRRSGTCIMTPGYTGAGLVSISTARRARRSRSARVYTLRASCRRRGRARVVKRRLARRALQHLPPSGANVTQSH